MKHYQTEIMRIRKRFYAKGELDIVIGMKKYIDCEADYPAYAVRKDNTISWKSNLYSLPLGTYKGPGTQVLVTSTKLELILLDQHKNELCRHAVSQLSGQKILKTNHTRDKRLAIAEMMEEFCGLMTDKEASMEWVSQIKEDKPRYIRDQIQLLIATVGNMGKPVAAQALEYCRKHQITVQLTLRL